MTQARHDEVVTLFPMEVKMRTTGFFNENDRNDGNDRNDENGKEGENDQNTE